MGTRVAGKTAIVVGSGQTPGAAVGNGRATALVLAREGARVLAVDRDLASAEETARLITGDGGEAFAMRVDVSDEKDLIAMAAACVERWGQIDILHNNVGVSHLSGDKPVLEIEADVFARITAINLTGMVLACKHVLPVMRRQQSGVVTNISSNATMIDYPYITYQTSKAGVVALTRNVAIQNAAYGIRANVIVPGLMDTPMAVEHRIGRDGVTREQVLEQRSSRIPLRGRLGSAWDVANAALFLASDEAGFITGTSLVIDGGQTLNLT